MPTPSVTARYHRKPCFWYLPLSYATMVAAPTLATWERRAELPLMVAAIAFLVAYALPIVVPSVSPLTARACEVVVTATWVLFALDYTVRLLLARQRWHFIRSHPLDLAGIALPVLRPLRLLRLIPLLSFLHRTSARGLRGRVVVYATAGTLLLVLCAALAITDAERGRPGAHITQFSEGLWWAFTTITTVGYGDITPVTLTGRCIAVALMIGGIALLGVVTATLASWLVARISDETEMDQAATRDQIEALTARVSELTDAVGRLSAEKNVS